MTVKMDYITRPILYIGEVVSGVVLLWGAINGEMILMILGGIASVATAAVHIQKFIYGIKDRKKSKKGK